MLTAEKRGAASVTSLARESYRNIALYSPPRGPVDVDLSDNTNLWGAPPTALRALATIGQDEVTRYPVAFEPDLAAALADYVGVSPAMIGCGCGSDDLLDSAIDRSFAVIAFALRVAQGVVELFLQSRHAPIREVAHRV